MLLEHNVIVKDQRKVAIRFASCYPNLYRSAMSSLGFHIVYDFLNSREDVYAERVVYPYIKSLETGSPLIDFDVIGFSLQYEQDYPHVLEMLRKGGVEVWKKNRDLSSPLVIAGGPCASSNPIPMTPFIDMFIVGDGEAILPGLMDKISEIDNPREELEEFQDLDGVYVPDNPVKINLLKNMKDAWRPINQVLPETGDKKFIPAFGRAFLLEVSRGCARGCRFCMAGCIYRPRREVPLKKLLETAKKGKEATGLDKIALIGAAVSDHSQIEKLCQGLLDMGFQITVPSLRIESITDSLLSILKESGLKTVTIAPESIWNLRRVINKPVSDENIKKVLENIFRHEMNVKLYLMLGLPTETNEDVEDLIKLIKNLYRISPRKSSLRISVNPFIPKPNTPFQWINFDFKDVKSKMRYIRGEFGSRYFKAESSRNSMIQYVLSMGDSSVASLIEKASFEKIPFNMWKQKSPQWDLKDHLPWENIDVGVKNQFLQTEYLKAMAGEITPWCETFGCYDCGACNKKNQVN